MGKVFSALLVLALCACALTQANPEPKSFNHEAFVGLEGLGPSYGEVALNYPLDARSGRTVTLDSCEEVDAWDEDDFISRQFQLYRLMKYNCKAAKMYHVGQSADVSYFPPTLSVAFLKSLPATAIPNIGGQSLVRRENTLADFDPAMKVVAEGEKNIRVLVDDTDIEYVELARADIDGDGVEDLVLRLDWSIVSATGQGFDLLVLKKPTPDAAITITERFPAAP